MLQLPCISLLVLLGCASCTGIGLRCDMIPEGVTAPKTSENGDRYRIDLSGNPEHYVPGEQYTVFLRTPDPDNPEHRFTHFLLSVVNENPEKVLADSSDAIGSLQLYGDAMIKFSDTCKNAVVETDAQPKSEVQILWMAPSKPSGCIKFRATVIESKDIWYSEDGNLTRTICEETVDNEDTQPKILKQCCTCDEAKYESDQIRTIIKARGVSYPNITAKTFAVFRVDNRHHLMSIVSMVDPSPDWIVGVSSLELCLKNCSWIESKVLNLYPWDVGTDDGITYLSPNQPSPVRQPIRRLRPDSPDDPKSPFYDPTGAQMKPFARLSLSRQRLYEKTCDTFTKEESDDGNTHCETTEWSDWSPCSATCGKGVKYKQRRYKYEESKYLCHKKLTERAACEAMQKHCPIFLPKPVEDPLCELGPWSSWSSCSVTCGQGIQTRDRKLKNRLAAKRCLVRKEKPPVLQQNLECWAEVKCENEYPDELEAEESDCPDRPWTDWSPCSATCDKGFKERFRLSFKYTGEQAIFWPAVKLRELHRDDEYDEEDPCTRKIRETVECFVRPCEKTTSRPRSPMVCGLPKDTGACKSNIDRWYFDTFRGQCEIFSYSGCEGNQNNFNTLEQCQTLCSIYQKEMFVNLTSRQKQIGIEISGAVSYNIQNDGKCVTVKPQYKHMSQPDQFVRNSPVTFVVRTDCHMSKWSQWSKCIPTDGMCGHGHKTKHRHVTVHPVNGGEKCPKKMTKRKRCIISCNHFMEGTTSG